MKVVWAEPVSYTWCLHSDPHFFKSVKEGGLKKKPIDSQHAHVKDYHTRSFLQQTQSSWDTCQALQRWKERFMLPCVSQDLLAPSVLFLEMESVCYHPKAGHLGTWQLSPDACSAVNFFLLLLFARCISLSRPDYFEAKAQLSAFQA